MMSIIVLCYFQKNQHAGKFIKLNDLLNIKTN